MRELETPRLLLRKFTEDDYEDLFEYVSDPKVTEYEPYKPMTEKETRDNLAWRCTTDEMIAVVLKENGKLIGNIYLGNRDFNSRELGYVFNQSYWGNGYAKEACQAVLADAFATGVHRIYAECDPLNTGSWKLLERIGFQREAHFKQNLYFWTDEAGSPIWKDTYVYALLDCNYF